MAKTKPIPGPTRAGIYTRVSTLDQAREGYSLGEQERKCREYIDHQGWVLDPEHVFSDEGVSGSLAHREQLDRLVAARDDLDVVVISSLDRLGRSTKNLLELYDVFGAKDVALVFLREHLDTTTPVGRLLRTILSAIAEFERELIIDRSKTGIAARTASGKPWGEPRYGFRGGDDGHWIEIPSEIAIIERVYRLRVEDGLSYQRIATKLNQEGVPTRRPKGNWTATTIRTLLTSRHVLGQYWRTGENGGEWAKGEHAPIISTEIWDAAQAIAARGSKFAPSRAGRQPARHLFTNGLLRCACCKEAMLPRSPGPGKGADHYVCRTNKMLGGDCPMPSHRRVDVDGRFLALFEREFLDLDATRERLVLELTRDGAESEASIEVAEREVARLERQLARVRADYLAETLSAASYEEIRDDLEEQLAGAQGELDQARRRHEGAQVALANIDIESETLHRLAALRDQVAAATRDAAGRNDIAALRALLSDAFDAVYLRVDGSFAGMEPGAMALRGHALPLETVGSGTGVPEYPAVPAEVLIARRPPPRPRR